MILDFVYYLDARACKIHAPCCLIYMCLVVNISAVDNLKNRQLILQKISNSSDDIPLKNTILLECFYTKFYISTFNPFTKGILHIYTLKFSMNKFFSEK